VRQFVTDAEYAKASRLLDRWGMVAILATRPVPIMAEVMSIIAGTTPAVRAPRNSRRPRLQDVVACGMSFCEKMLTS
jgi:hypothetical protein